MVLMKIAHPKTNIRRTFLAKLCFDFMVDIVTIELGFSQQVAAEAFKNLLKLSFRCKSRDRSIGAGLSYYDGNQILASREGRKNRYVKCEAIDSHILVRTHAIHLRLDSQFNLSRLVIPIGIGIYNVPSRKSSRFDVADLRLHY
jgi:hypothetical protein